MKTNKTTTAGTRMRRLTKGQYEAAIEEVMDFSDGVLTDAIWQASKTNLELRAAIIDSAS